MKGRKRVCLDLFFKRHGTGSMPRTHKGSPFFFNAYGTRSMLGKSAYIRAGRVSDEGSVK